MSRLSKNDPSSFSCPELVKTESLHLKWTIEFERKAVVGSVTHQIVKLDKSAHEIIFDVSELKIKSVKTEDGNNLSYCLGGAVEAFGQPLKVQLPKDVDKIGIVIDYETTDKCSALQWLSKEQTSGKQHPYMFSQCQAIHARSLFPCQDTPSVKAPYSAEVTVDTNLTVLMSAVREGEGSVKSDCSSSWKFHQKVPIPSYLVAIVVGRLSSKRIGPRSTVWAEKEQLETAAFDFSETEDFIKTAEDLMGEYVWGIYDILVLPPSFPFGGMENPCLTFATPTLLTGDKSLSNVIAHEISHSWTGNLVTNKTFEDFWLNEGFTVYTERRILGALKGEAFRQFEAIGGWKVLKETVKELGPTNPLTCLFVKLDGVHPDDSFSSIPYEKGFAFLYYLEQLVGGPGVFTEFLKDYVKQYSYKTLTTEEFKDYFLAYFDKKGKATALKEVDWNTWLYAPGMPPFSPKYDKSLADTCLNLKTQWLNWNPIEKKCPFSKADLESFTMPSIQIIEFLAELLGEEGPIPLDKLKAMDAAYGLSDMKNSEIRFRWIRLCMQGKWIEKLPLALQFVSEQGRMKFIRPIYRDLYAWEEVREKAIENFRKNEPSMMYVSAYAVSKDLHLRD